MKTAPGALRRAWEIASRAMQPHPSDPDSIATAVARIGYAITDLRAELKDEHEAVEVRQEVLEASLELAHAQLAALIARAKK